MGPKYDVISRAPDLTRKGPISFLTLNLVLRFNAVSTAQITVDADTDSAALLSAGYGVIIRQRDVTGVTRVVFSGSINEDEDEAAEGGDTLTFNFDDDTALLWERFIYADPSVDADSQLSGTGDVRTGVLETIMRELVNLNLGPGALVPRRQAGLALATDGLHGPSITSSAVEFAVLGDHLAGIALNGGLGFKIVDVAGTLEFQVYEPVDRSTTIRFSFKNQNLRSYKVTTTSPTSTVAIIAAGDDNALRFFTEYSNADSVAAQMDWGDIRREGFVSRTDSIDPDVITQAGDEYLATNGPTVTVAFDAVDTEDMEFIRHYGLGDKVLVITRKRGRIAQVMQQATLDVGGDGAPARFKPIIGTAGATDPAVPLSYTLLRTALVELGLLKRRL